MKYFCFALVFAILFLPACENSTNIQKKLDEAYKKQQAREKIAKEAAEKKRLLELSRIKDPQNRALHKQALKLKEINQTIKPAQPGEWLEHFDEKGQTFKQYINSNPIVPTSNRNKIYVLPIGSFDRKQRELVNLATEYLEIFFSLEVTKLKALPNSAIPQKARRKNTFTQKPQFLATYILDDLLLQRLPEDAVAMISFTATDLWPGEQWNFVFGMASLKHRVGVWSINRLGNPAESEESFRLALLRTLKIASHETAHMFSMEHCTAYECNMNGSNNMQEADESPLWLCPECVAKLWWLSKTDKVGRCNKLSEFLAKQGLLYEAQYYRQAALILSERYKTSHHIQDKTEKNLR